MHRNHEDPFGKTEFVGMVEQGDLFALETLCPQVEAEPMEI
jgi:hypothetical protein